MAAELVLNIISKIKEEGKSLSDVIGDISTYSNTGEVNFAIADKQKAMDEVLNYFSDQDFNFFDFDGYRLEFKDWWFNIRPSNTEPYLRFLAEAKTDKLLKEKTEIIYEILSRYS